MRDPTRPGYDETARVLAAVADTTPAAQHGAAWSFWARVLTTRTPTLAPRTKPDPTDPTATHEFCGLGGVRIGARLLMPEDGPPHAGVVTSHGYGVGRTLERESRRWRRLTQRGVAVLLVRLRGYPGSSLDTGDLTTATSESPGWIARGLADLDDGEQDARAFLRWVVPQAVADLADACRALRTVLGSPDARIFLHGESLGGGLAVIAAAQLTAVPAGGVERLAIGLPSLGDWPSRLGVHATGAGADVRAVLDHLGPGPRSDAVLRRLRLLDAVVHAPRVRMPTLCKLAARDEVVPPTTAAAVYNALRADPGQKWRFVTHVGHAGGGPWHDTDARRHAMFERMVDDFFDPARPPSESLRAWEALLCAGERPPEPERAPEPPAATLFGDEPDRSDRDRTLTEAYERAGRTLDSLPYTPEFETIYAGVRTDFASKRDALHRLQNLRKAGKLPKLGKAPDTPPKIDPAHERTLTELVAEGAGSLGQRDRLVYTPAFDALAERFNAATGLALSHHDLWRVIAKLAK